MHKKQNIKNSGLFGRLAPPARFKTLVLDLPDYTLNGHTHAAIERRKKRHVNVRHINRHRTAA